MTDGGLRRLAVALVRHAGRALPKARFQWATAMQHEVGHIADDAAALRWALGCVLASYKERITAMGLPAVNPGPTLASPDDDPFLWLEDLDSPRALAWVGEQNGATLARFGSDARFAADRDALAAILDHADRIPHPWRYGSMLLNLWIDAAHPRGLVRTTTLDSFRNDNPAWDVLLDVDDLAARENEDWVVKSMSIIERTYDRAEIRLSRGGADAMVLREFDLTTRAFVPDGFNLPAQKGWTVWLDRDTVLLCSPAGDGMATRDDRARTVRLWRRGTDPLAAPVIFEGKFESLAVNAEVDLAPETGTERLVFMEFPSAFDTITWIGDRSGARTRLDVPTDAHISWVRGWLVIKLAKAWSVGGESFAPDAILGILLAAFLAGERRFARLFEPGPRRVLNGFAWSGDRLLLSILDNLEPVFEILTSSKGWARERVTGLPEKGVAYVRTFDAYPKDSNGDFVAEVETPLVPPSLFLLAPGRPPDLLKRAPAAFDAKGMVITRHEAVSTDGERIPYTQIGPAGETGEAPVHLHGYGAFGEGRLPVYDATIGKLWLEQGGTRVIAHLRGGNEFGTAWHDAGRRAGKRLAHDDFAAIAADLVRRGVTRPGRIAAAASSLGGNLITNMLTRYPERFGALFSTVPVIDMRRFAKMGFSRAIAEWGDPDEPEDWAFMAPISAYHTAVPGKPYPPILLASNRSDDRVHPGHARKMAAKLQAMGYDARYYELDAGGHAHGKNNRDTAASLALGFTFLRDAIGWKA